MENQILDDLENRISKAIEMIGMLRKENRQLKEEKIEMTAQLQEQEKNIERLRQRCEDLSRNENQTDQIMEKMGRIKDRIQAIITKLDELEPLA